MIITFLKGRQDGNQNKYNVNEVIANKLYINGGKMEQKNNSPKRPR